MKRHRMIALAVLMALLVGACNSNAKSMAPEAGFNIYPNPSTGIITIEMPGMSNISLTIRDITNKVIQTRKLSDNTRREVIDLSSAPKGIYIIEVSSQEHTYQSRVVLK